MAFKREYLINHKHKDGFNMAEEASFTNSFNEPIIQINPLYCIIISSHGKNTFNKKLLIEDLENPYISEVTNMLVTDLIPIDIFENMKKIF